MSPSVRRAFKVVVVLAGVLLMVAAAAGCKRGGSSGGDGAAGEAGPGGVKTLGSLQVTDARQDLLLTYADGKGGFETASKVDAVPREARTRVRVVDPQKPIEKRTDLDLVYVADLARKGADGAYPVWVLPRARFEAEALKERGGPGVAAAASPGTAADGGALPAAAAIPADGGAAPQVILYSTSWCGACKATRRHLTQKHIPFVEKDIESDAAARGELRAKAEKAGLPWNRVPVLDVRGHLLLGFDPARLDALLGRPI
jgi:glutaredoxin